jgi:hypothetical protein
MTTTVRATVVDDRLIETRCRGYRSCVQCAWQASMTGDSAEEVERFLDKVLNQHIVDVHAERGGT